MTTTTDDDLDDLLNPAAPDSLDDPSEGDGEREWVMAAGSEFFVIRPGLNLTTGTGEMTNAIPLVRGMVIVLTAAMIESNTDRNGDTWLSLIDDEEAQTDRWGSPMVAPGRPGPGFSKWLRGSVEAELERARQLDEAHKIANDAERAEALAAIQARFGKVRTSRTLGSYDGGRLS